MNKTYWKIVEAIAENKLDEMVRLVDETNFDIDAEQFGPDSEGNEGETHYCWPLLTEAIHAGAETPIIDWLIKRGAKKYDTALWAAVRTSHVGHVRRMIQLGANVIRMKDFRY